MSLIGATVHMRWAAAPIVQDQSDRASSLLPLNKAHITRVRSCSRVCSLDEWAQRVRPRLTFSQTNRSMGGGGGFSGGGGSGGGGRGGGGGGDGGSPVPLDCEKVGGTVRLQSPVPNVVNGLSAGQSVDISVRQGRVYIESGGSVAGVIAGTWVSRLVECINAGQLYTAQVKAVNSGLCDISIRHV